VAFLAAIALFAPTVWSFGGTWTQGIMAHGWLIAGLVCWLIWRHRHDFLQSEGGDLLLLVPLAAMSIGWMLATVARIQTFHQLTFLLVLVVWGILVAGRRNLRLVLLIGATFGLAVPVWGAVTPVLQRLTTIMSGAMVKLVGIPADIRGDLITIPEGTFYVADGCAGAGFFVSALAVGALYAHLMVRNWVGQLAVLGAAAAMALFANWFRVGSLIVIGHVTDMQSGLIANHYNYGWIIFTIGLVPFFFAARQIEKRADRGTPPEPAAAAPVDETQYRRMLRHAALGVMVAASGPVLYYTFSALPSTTQVAPALASLASGEGWVADAAAQSRPFSWQPEYQGATRHETPSFTDGTRRVYADRFVFQRQTQGAKLIGYPNRIADPDVVRDDRIVGPVDRAGTLWVRQAVISTPDGGVLTWYWYRVGGTAAVYSVHAKLLEVPAFFTRRRSAELVALSAPCDEGGCANAFQALASLTGAPGFRGALPGEAPPAQD
jgi:EpsI family protein